MEYKFYKGADSIGHDILFIGRKPIDELQFICDTTPNAVGFSTTGYIKYRIDVDKMLPLPTSYFLEDDGVYVKVNVDVPNSMTYSDSDSGDDSFGFIITRHVNSEITNNYWQESYRCIRKHHDSPIIIIDDNSNQTFVTELPANFVNCTVVQSEYPQRGELLGYYYFHKLKPFNIAIILHDSVFIKQPINKQQLSEPVSFFWHAVHNWDYDLANIGLLQKLNDSDKLVEFYKTKSNWNVCFGVMSIIKHDFLEFINTRHNFFILLDYIRTRADRINLERIFGCVCSYNYNMASPSILGLINQYTDKEPCCPTPDYMLKWPEYVVNSDKYVLPVMKIYTGR